MPERTRPGSPCPDAPLNSHWLLRELGGDFTLLAIDCPLPQSFEARSIKPRMLRISAKGNDAISARYLGRAEAAIYLIRPDQHVVARWDHFEEEAVAGAIARVLGCE